MMDDRVLPRVSILLLALFLAPTLQASAQSRTTSAIRGTVTRADSIPLSEVLVTLVHQETGSRRSVLTNDRGRFLIPLLQPGGPYTLSATLLGFGEKAIEAIELQVGEVESLTLVMEEVALEVPGVTVVAERADVFTPTQMGPATRLSEVAMEAVPLLSRDFTELATLSTLVTTAEGGGFSVAGQNARYNSILVDGVSNKDVFGLTPGGTPGGQAGAKIIPLDAVAQYEILVSPFDVRLSGFTGGVMNAVTRHGTNDWRVRGFAVHRNEALMGDLTMPTGTVEASGVDRNLFGLSVGGPIIRDRAHFFLASEFEERNQPPLGFNLYRDDPALIRISSESMENFQDFLETDYGLDAGNAGAYTLVQELENIFGRVDWDFGNGHRVTIRNVWARATNDESPNRGIFEPYELSSNTNFRQSTNNTASVQLFSELSGGRSNELTLELQRTVDETRPATGWPQVGIELLSSIGGTGFLREARVGSQFYGQDNNLKQTTVRLTNSLTIAQETSTFILGFTGALYDINHRFLPGSAGEYFYSGWFDFRANAPSRYQRTVLEEGEPPGVDFNVLEWGLFAQREMSPGKGLTMKFGVRVDVPHVLHTPEENRDILQRFQKSTSNVPSRAFLISPRWGFNWQRDGERRTQVRGGAGVFAGQLPFVWLSNAFHNDGLRSFTQLCTGRWIYEPPEGNTVPPFDPAAPPTECVYGPFEEVRTVTLFDKDFKYPRVFRISLGVDQEITEEISGSLGVLLSHAMNKVAITDLNLGTPPDDLPSMDGYGGYQRLLFGNPAPGGFSPNPKLQGYNQVLLATNRGRGQAVSLTAEIRGRLRDALRFQVGYTFAHSLDDMSLVSTDMMSNMGYNAIAGDPNDPPLRYSIYDRPHKVVAGIYGTPFPWLPDTELSLLYTGQSGAPFSYVYEGDMNGDGFPGPAGAFDRYNDLVYVPEEATEVPASFGTLQLLASALRTDPCLKKHKGEFMERNSCRAPWQNRLDLRLAHTLRIWEADIRLEGDLINLLNVIHPRAGIIQTVRQSATLLEPRKWSAAGLTSQWAGGILPKRDEDGRLVASEPWSIMTPDSQWQLQFGVRVTFGEGR